MNYPLEVPSNADRSSGVEVIDDDKEKTCVSDAEISTKTLAAAVSADSVDDHSSRGIRGLFKLQKAELGEDTEPKDSRTASLKPRHLRMIALGSGIGTGLFIASGNILKSGGPGSLLIGYIVMGAMVCCVVNALGEMCCMFPGKSSFSYYTRRFTDEASSFTQGVLYCCTAIVMFPAEITAAGFVAQHWQQAQKFPTAGWMSVFFAFVVVIACTGTRGYGETEFLASMLKVAAVVIFFFTAIIINCGGAPKGGYIGLRYWHDPGAFNNGFKGFCSVFITAAFSLAGVEIIGIAAGQTKNPQKAIPGALKRVFYRILGFFVITLFIVSLNVAYNDSRLGTQSGFHNVTSPFILAIQDGGIRVLPDIVNAVILISILSVANTSVFMASNTIYGMALSHQAPPVFTYVNKHGLPVVAVGLCFAFGFLAYVNTTKGGETLFSWLTNISGTASLLVWISLSYAHIRMRLAMRVQGVPDDIMPYRNRFGICASVFAIVINSLALIAQIWIAIWPVGGAKPSANYFFEQVIGIPIGIAAWFGWLLCRRTGFPSLKDIDLTTGRYDQGSDFDRETFNEKLHGDKPQTIRGRVYDFFC
ncbi:amino acid permease [Schizosaccharomyces japonicus yFS275]|uniref:Amino acid permease n=1 Tax=Schizosaccharomyces japonicus (strain yFS275 / FY16936) TaxID=402676 RepID=B6JZF6_SCHJY|nr:amino acid permease [Schizosaccharomyces japonicus yFS275]EEB06924.1 amino acid permease [Schizosaccharomyces japonicus yFS275]